VLYPVENGYLGRYKRRVRSRLEEVKAKLEIIQHGLGFHLYRSARQHQENGAWKKALADWKNLIETADENEGTDLEEVLSRRDGEEVTIQDLKEQLPVAPVYRKAANYYKYVAKTELGNYRKAYRGLETFIKQGEKYQLYGGAARRFQADIALEYMYQPDKAIPLYTKALEWFNEVEKRDQAVEQFTVPEKAKSVTKPPNTFRGRDRWGNVVWRLGGPSDLFNRNTADYYEAYQRMITKTHRSLCYFILSVFKESKEYRKRALQDIKVITEVDKKDAKLTEQNRPSNYLRLRDGYRLGKLFAKKYELNLFSSKKKLLTALLVGDFHYEIERWSDAESAYKRLVQRFGKRSLSHAQKAYLNFVLANCAGMQGNRDKARKMLSGFKNEFKHTPTFPRAMLVYASYLNDSKKKYEALKLVIEKVPEHPMSNQALLNLGKHFLADGEFERAQTMFRRASRSSDAKWRSRGAENAMELIEKIQKGNGKYRKIRQLLKRN
jgi:tetratricopeptide (TPR) repeat protein